VVAAPRHPWPARKPLTHRYRAPVAELKTKPTGEDVAAFLDAVPDVRRRDDARAVCALLREVTGQEPRMWGSSIVGFGDTHYRYASGHEGDTFVVGLSPRKAALTVYVMDGFEGREELLSRLGRHSTGKGCLYVKRLADVDLVVLRELLTASVRRTTAGR
jgi:hypothetical protein